MTTSTSRLFGLMAETAIHAGASGSSGVVDLPIMREHHTGWPVVFGSAVKGALRANAEQQLDAEDVFALFGPDTGNASDHAGALLISDARLLLLPVRSLTSQFRLVTCPDLLRRWQRDCERAGDNAPLSAIPNPADANALVSDPGKHQQLFLEEYVYTLERADLNEMIQSLAQLAGRSESEIEEKLTIISNDQFTHLCQAAIPVQPHIAIENATKTVRNGALWYEESLPPETLLYSLISAQRSRRETHPLSADDLMASLEQELFGACPYVQVGGNETTGMGWCRIKSFAGGEQ